MNFDQLKQPSVEKIMNLDRLNTPSVIFLYSGFLFFVVKNNAIIKR